MASAEETHLIPEWVKNNAGWWADGQIPDSAFIDGIEFLIKAGLIVVSSEQQNESQTDGIPEWVKNNAGWWANGTIDDNSFVKSIEFLIESNIIKISPANEKIINFTVTADLSPTPETEKNLKNIHNAEPEIILFAGDLMNDNGPPKKWFEMTEFLDNEKIHVAIGNHDIIKDHKNQYLRYYDLEKSYYSFDYENVHFIILDTEEPITSPSEQFNFLLSDLESTKNDSEINWIIVMMHRPMHSDGTHFHSKDIGQHLTGLNLRFNHMLLWKTTLQPIFDYYNVDLIIQGHNHFYERSFPLKSNNMISEIDDSHYVDPDGQIYLTVGSGGHSLHNNVIQKSESSVKQIKKFGFLNLELSSDGNTINGTFVDLNEEILDEFYIQKKSMQKTSKFNFKDELLLDKDFSNQNLFLKDLSSLDLSDVNFRYADLVYANLSNSNLVNANLQGANLQGTDLSGIDLSGFNLSGTNLTFQSFENTDLSTVILNDSILYGTNLNRQNLSEKNLSNMNMQKSKFSLAILNGANISNSDLESSILIATQIYGTNFESTNLSYSFIHTCDFSTSDLSDTNFSNSLIRNSDFRNISLTNTNFSNSIVVGSSFDYQDLTNVNLQNTDLSPKSDSSEFFKGTSMTYANLEGMDLSSTIFSRDSKQYIIDTLIGDPSNITKAQYEITIIMVREYLKTQINDHPDLSNSNLSTTNISEKNRDGIDTLNYVNFSNADLSNTNFSNSIMVFSILTGADLTNAKLNCENHRICI